MSQWKEPHILFLPTVKRDTSNPNSKFPKESKASWTQIKFPVKRVRSDNDTEFTNHLRSDNDIEFTNQLLNSLLVSKEISHNFSPPYTSQQNGVVERRNITLDEAARSILYFAYLPLYFWAETVETGCFVQNRSIISKCLNKTRS